MQRHTFLIDDLHRKAFTEALGVLIYQCAEESEKKELSKDRVPKRPVACSMSLFLKAPEERHSK